VKSYSAWVYPLEKEPPNEWWRLIKHVSGTGKGVWIVYRTDPGQRELADLMLTLQKAIGENGGKITIYTDDGRELNAPPIYPHMAHPTKEAG